MCFVLLPRRQKMRDLGFAGFAHCVELYRGLAVRCSHLEGRSGPPAEFSAPWVPTGVSPLEGSDFAAIRAATNKAWERVTEGACRHVSNRVRRNMKKIIARQGGNWYSETTARKIDLNIDPPCVVCTSTYAKSTGPLAMMLCERYMRFWVPHSLCESPSCRPGDMGV